MPREEQTIIRLHSRPRVTVFGMPKGSREKNELVFKVPGGLGGQCSINDLLLHSLQAGLQNLSMLALPQT
eukprot:4364587-Pyramimonas_sp.AAC.1